MRTKTLKFMIGVLIFLALVCGLDLPRFLLPDWSPLARAALNAAGQLLAYAAMAALAVCAEPLIKDHDSRFPHS